MISDRIKEMLGVALQAEQDQVSTDGDQGVDEAADSDSGIITTEEELGGLLIIRAICSERIDPMRLLPKDTKSYFNVLLDGKPKKPVVRLRLDGSIKRVEFFDGIEPKSEVIDGPSGLYQHQERIRNALSVQLGNSDPNLPIEQSA